MFAITFDRKRSIASGHSRLKGEQINKHHCWVFRRPVWSFLQTGFCVFRRRFLLLPSFTTFTLYQNGFCHVNSSELTAQIQSYTNVTSGDALALKLALFKNGPVAVSIDASHRSFVFYSYGVYYEPACGEFHFNLFIFEQMSSVPVTHSCSPRQHHWWPGPRCARGGVRQPQRGAILADKELMVHLLG